MGDGWGKNKSDKEKIHKRGAAVLDETSIMQVLWGPENMLRIIKLIKIR